MRTPFIHRPTGNRPLAEKIDQLRQQAQALDPNELAMRIGAEFIPADRAVLQIPWWGQNLHLLWPELIPEDLGNAPVRDDILALLLYHFLISRGEPLTGRWISFSELPDGKFYAQAYQGYSGNVLQTAFSNDQSAFERAASSAGGKRLSILQSPEQSGSSGLPDSAFVFQPLPRLALLAVMWPGDEDFPATYQVIFDASAPQHLPTDVCAILGGMLARRIVRFAMPPV
jgi:hypothetical protein